MRSLGELAPVVEPPAGATQVGQQDGPATVGAGSLVWALVSLVRPGQWPKNILVVSIPLIDLDTWSLTSIWRMAWAVATFTAASTIVYVVNDIADRHRDREHPTKRHRPIAAGRVSVRTAILVLAVQCGLLVSLMSLQPWSSSWPIGLYLLLATGYSTALKHVPLVDVFVVASGFGLRLMQGYVGVGAEVSGWLLTCVFSLCLLLTVGKRRQELAATDGAYRPALSGYTVALTDQLMVLSAVLTAGSYLLYLRMEAPLGTYGLAAAALSAPFALFGLFRYLQLVLVHEGGDNPVRMLLRDPALVINSLLWLALSAGFLVASHLAVPTT